jgi:hypothetical protein
MVLEDSRSEKKKEKFNFKKRKDCTIHSIKEVEKTFKEGEKFFNVDEILKLLKNENN